MFTSNTHVRGIRLRVDYKGYEFVKEASHA